MYSFFYVYRHLIRSLEFRMTSFLLIFSYVWNIICLFVNFKANVLIFKFIVFLKKKNNNRETEYYIAKKHKCFIIRNGDLTCNHFFLVNISELGYNCSFHEFISIFENTVFNNFLYVRGANSSKLVRIKVDGKTISFTVRFNEKTWFSYPDASWIIAIIDSLIHVEFAALYYIVILLFIMLIFPNKTHKYWKLKKTSLTEFYFWHKISVPIVNTLRPIGSGAAWRRSPHQKSAGGEREKEAKGGKKRRRKKREEKKERKGEEIKRERCITSIWV